MSNNVLFEIGLEELPARFIDDAETQLINKTERWLEELRIPYDFVSSFSTPRRLAVLINGIADKQNTIQEEVRGPAENIAQDSNGNWTKAAIGFTKGQGKTVNDIYVKDIKGMPYTFVEKYIEGSKTFHLLNSFQEIIMAIQFKENMHWGTESVRFARPIRWIVALYNDKIIPFEIAHVKTSNVTYGHRFLGKEITLQDPLNYERSLRENFVIPNKDEREQLIRSGIKNLELKEDFYVIVDSELLSEVRNLVEYPTVFCGSFENDFLTLPPEVLIISMKEHQRYFPVTDKDERLLPYFLGVRNGDQTKIETVIKGNEKVLHARLSDARFFYEEDQKQSIAINQNKLTRVVFQKQLGTLSEKVNRIQQITKQLVLSLNIDESVVKQSIRAAEICKFDLMTNMVNEFTELQGIMGEKYAIIQGEEEAVAKAIKEHYLPRQSYGELPESVIGAVISVADKLDTIIGFISVGMTPTGSQDPYSLRRQAIGVLRILNDRKWMVTLESMIEIAQNQFKDHLIEPESKDLINDFFKLRASYLLKVNGIEQDVIESVLHRDIGAYNYTATKASTLSVKRNDPEFKETQEALVRVLNLAKPSDQTDIQTTLFQTQSEELLYNEYERVAKEYNLANNSKQAEQALDQLSQLADPIHRFFEQNMVMAEDRQIRNNRIALVNAIANMIKSFADLTLIQWKQHQ